MISIENCFFMGIAAEIITGLKILFGYIKICYINLETLLLYLLFENQI